MLIESAFSMLPETVAGYGFQKVKREANAVGSFAFSLLNALHSKNILDPIQRIQMEKHYASKTVPLPQNGDNRHCDIFLDYGGSKIGTVALANFGWRYQNYLEAKFLRSYKRTPSGQDTRSSANSAEIVADLIRLVALVPEPQAMANQPDAKVALPAEPALGHHLRLPSGRQSSVRIRSLAFGNRFQSEIPQVMAQASSC